MRIYTLIFIFLQVICVKGQWEATNNQRYISGAFGVAAISVNILGGMPNVHEAIGLNGSWGGRFRPNNPSAAKLGLGVLALQGISLGGLWFSQDKSNKEPLVWMNLQSFSTTYLLTQFSKSFFGRTRPYAVGMPYQNDYDAQRSFWSSTSAFSGTALGMIWVLTADKSQSSKMMIRSLSALSTVGVMWSRVRAGQHHPSDVLVGATVGVFIGYLTPRMYAIPGGVGLSLGN